MEQHWFSWAGPPDQMTFDPLRGHLVDTFQQMGEGHNALMRPVPAESPEQKARIERAISFWKDLFARLDHAMQLRIEDVQAA